MRLQQQHTKHFLMKVTMTRKKEEGIQKKLQSILQYTQTQ